MVSGAVTLWRHVQGTHEMTIHLMKTFDYAVLVEAQEQVVRCRVFWTRTAVDGKGNSEANHVEGQVAAVNLEHIQTNSLVREEDHGDVTSMQLTNS